MLYKMHGIEREKKGIKWKKKMHIENNCKIENRSAVTHISSIERQQEQKKT